MLSQIIEDLYKFPRFLLGEGYNNALAYIFKLIPLEIGMVKSGTKLGDWIVPEEWIIRDAWVKLNGEKILDFKLNPMCVADYSIPIHQTVSLEELKKHLMVSDEKPEAYSYSFKFYEKNWGFTMPRNQLQNHIIRDKDGKIVCENGICVPELKDIDPTVGKVMIDGVETSPKFEDILPEGEYEVFIDSEFKKGVMKYGVHIIKGTTDREILLFAHLDHPHQANDNLSSVACLIDMADRLHDEFFEHTIKLVFCPETIGSMAYIHQEDISKVDFVIALECVGNDNSLLIQKSFDKDARINACMHLACSSHAVDYRKGEFRQLLGSDEYHFNDPKIGIPGILLSRFPYPEYHTSLDTPTIINYEKIKEVQDTIINIIQIYEQDFIPTRTLKGALMRSKHDIQTEHKLLNRDLDYLWYNLDGKTYLSKLVVGLGLTFEYSKKVIDKLISDGVVKRSKH